MPDFRAAVRARLLRSRLGETLVAEIAEEIAAHLQDVYREHLAAGASARTAEEVALAELDDPSALLERLPRRLVRAAPRLPWKRGSLGVGLPSRRQRFESVVGDLRHGVRVLRRRRLFTVAALLTLALGIGANSAIFSVVYGVLLRPLPWPDADRIVRIWRSSSGAPTYAGPLTDAEVERLESLAALDRVAAYSERQVRTDIGDVATQLDAASATVGFDAVLGLRPSFGRWLHERAEAPEIVLAEPAAARLFGTAASAVGQSLPIEGESHRVVGTLATTSAYPPGAEAWLLRPILDLESASMRFATLNVVATLSAAANVAQISGALQAIATTTEDLDQERYSVEPLSETIVGAVRPILLRFSLGVGLVLLIACANVGNLLLELSSARRGERAVRRALGAGRLRLVRQSLAESVLLGGLGAALAVLLAWATVRLFVAFNPLAIPRLGEIRVDLPVLAFTLTAGVLSGLACGIVPALRSARAGLAHHAAAGEDGSGRGWARRALASVEIALSLALLVGAGLLAHSFVRIVLVDPGYEPGRLLAARLDFGGMEDAAAANQGVADAMDRLRAVPGVEAVAFAEIAPPSQGIMEREVMIEGRPLGDETGRPRAQVIKVSADYFTALGLELVEGAAFSVAEVTATRRLAVVNETFVSRHLVDRRAVGQRLLLDGRLVEIVGVVADARLGDVRDEPSPVLYQPGQNPVSQMSMGGRTVRFASEAWLVMRVSGDTERIAARVRDVARAMPTAVSIRRLDRVADRVWDTLAAPRFLAGAVAAFALAGVLLAAIGVYAVMVNTVRGRVHEIGVRIALGATERNIVRSVMVDGLTTIGLGLAAGAGLALLLGRYIGSFLYGIEATDAATYLAVTLLLGSVAALATYLPARRAVSIDPVEALRRSSL